MPLTAHEIETALARVSFLPDWTFTYDGERRSLDVRRPMPDSRGDGAVQAFAVAPTDHATTEAKFLFDVITLVIRSVLHEVREHLRVDGVALYDPHEGPLPFGPVLAHLARVVDFDRLADPALGHEAVTEAVLAQMPLAEFLALGREEAALMAQLEEALAEQPEVQRQAS